MMNVNLTYIVILFIPSVIQSFIPFPGFPQCPPQCPHTHPLRLLKPREYQAGQYTQGTAEDGGQADAQVVVRVFSQ